MTDRCPVCHRPVGEAPAKMRYEQRVYAFDRDACKRIFQENPDRYLDPEGGILPNPR